MRFAIAIIFTSIVTLAGCSSGLEVFKRVEVGKPLPQKLPAGLYRTGIGFGHTESGLSVMPSGRWSRRLQVLTDDNGVVVGKAAFDVRPLIDYGGTAIVAETTTVEVQVPLGWWNEPSAGWGQNIPPSPTWDMLEVHRYLRTHREKEQRAFIRQWQGWYERHLDESGAPSVQMNSLAGALAFAENSESQTSGTSDPPKHSKRTALDYLSLAAQLLEAVPTGAEGSSDEVRCSDAPVASAPIWLASSGQHDLDPRQVTSDGFKWQGSTGNLRVTCENLGARRIRLQVVMRGEERSFRDPLLDINGAAVVKTFDTAIKCGDPRAGFVVGILLVPQVLIQGILSLPM